MKRSCASAAPTQSSFQASNTAGERFSRSDISRQDACHYEARFRGTFFKVIPFQYRMTLTAVRHDDHYDLSGEKNLGRLMGVYRFRGYATSNNFVAHYSSKDDQGRFLMSRK